MIGMTPHERLRPLFDRDTLLPTNAMFFGCHVDVAQVLHATALELAHEYHYVVVDVAIGEDPREALFRTVGREANIGLAVEAHFKTTKRDVVVIIRDAARFAGNEDGLAIMRGLKSARDRVNPRLRLLFFGSDIDAMYGFVSSDAAPFFGDALSRC
jgi:hypothetical protein